MLDVSLHGRRVGAVVREPETSVLSFVLDEGYLADGARDVLGQQFEDRRDHRILAGNTDAHLKNWSLVYPDRRTARLAPTYDMVFVRYYLPTNKLALPIAKEKDPARIGWEHVARLERFLRSHGLDAPVVAEARAFVRRCLEAWEACRQEFAEAQRARLEEHLAGMPLGRIG